MKVCAIIPARGGSKGIPRKNARLLAGKPLVGHTVETALRARRVNRTLVSTDDAEIGAIAQRYGAEVVWRPPEISGDTASSELALLHCLDFLKGGEGYEPDLIVFLQCTEPLILPEDIDGTVETLLEKNADSALAVAPFQYFVWTYDQTGNAMGVNHDKELRLPRQQRGDQFLETGAVYVMRNDGFKKTKHRFFGKTVMYVIPYERCLGIDEPLDLVIAEAVFEKRREGMCLQLLPNPVAALVLDFDGVFTDNRVFVSQDGTEGVMCNRGDGLGLAKIKQVSIPILVLSTEENPVVSARCRKLGLECLQGMRDKRAALLDWVHKKSLNIANVVYVGNDVNDLSCMELVGCSVAVSDAHPTARRAARVVLSKPGGYGAIREICDLILARMGEAI